MFAKSLHGTTAVVYFGNLLMLTRRVTSVIVLIATVHHVAYLHQKLY